MNNLTCNLEAVTIGIPSSSESTGIASQTRNQLLSLPNELLLPIIDYSRPDGFEALLLTCRRLYNVGHPLIWEHQQCVKWHDKVWRHRHSILDLLESLNRYSPGVRPALLDYLTISRLRSNYWYWRSRHAHEGNHSVQSIYQEDSWLWARIIEVINRIRASIALADAEKSQILSPRGPFPAFESWFPLYCSQGCIYHMMVPLLCRQTKRLTLFNDHHGGVSICVPRLLNVMGSQQWPLLRELRITRNRWGRNKELAPQITLKTISPVLKLSSLEVLDVDGLRVSEEDVRSTSDSLQPLSDVALPQRLNHLRLDSVMLTPIHYRQLFGKVRHLQSLTLDLHGLFTDEYRPYIQPDQQKKWMTKLAGLIHENVTESGGHRPPIVNFQATIDEIQAAIGDQLTHLAMKFFWTNHKRPVVSPRMQILDFKQFTRLIYIEIDLRLLQPLDLSLQAEPIFRPLSKILPRTIETVRVFFTRGNYTNLAIHQLIGDAQILRRSCPNLSKLEFVPQQRGLGKRSDQSRFFTELADLRGQLQGLGIEVTQHVIPQGHLYQLGVPGPLWRQQPYIGEEDEAHTLWY